MAMSSSLGVNVIKQFDGTNFSNWEFRIKLLLEQYEVVDVLNEDEPQDDDKKKDYKKRDVKARNIIVQSLTDNILETVKDRTTAKEIMNTLKNTYAKTGIATQVKLQRELRNLRYEGECSLMSFLGKFEKLIGDLKGSGGQIDNKEIVTQLLSAMPANYQSVTTAIDILFSSNPEIVTLDFVKNRLLMEESRQCRDNEFITSPSPSAFANQRNKPKFNNFGRNHHGYKHKYNNSSEGTVFKFKCYECGEKGHKRSDCPKKKTVVNEIRKTHVGLADKNISFLSEINNIDTLNAESDEITVKFVVDSGSTHHLVDLDTGKLLEEATDVNFSINVAKEGETIVAKRCGKLKVKLHTGIHVSIENVYECQGLTKNLLSVRQIEQKGFCVNFENNTVNITTSDGQLILKGFNCNNLYMVEMKLQSHDTLLVSNNSDLWHRRMGHSCAYPPSKLCEVCLQGKQTRQPFKSLSNERKAKRLLEVVSTDVCGPVDPISHDGMKYFVTFIDHFSHFVVVYAIKAKGDVFEQLKVYEAMVTAKFGVKIERLRCDGGGEYVSNELKQFCAEKGIVVEYTVPHTPEQNGVAERFNRTLVETVRCLLFDSQLRKCFRTEALRTATYLLNRRPTSTLAKGVLPAEIWYGYKPDLNKIKVFGSKAFVHVPKANRKKLDECSKPVIMIGYATNGYRLWDEETKKILIAKDVVFEESQSNFKNSAEMLVNIDQNISTDEQKDKAKTCEEFLDDSVLTKHESEIRRSNRERKQPKWLDDYETNVMESYFAGNMFNNGPKTYEQALENGWKDAIEEELDTLQRNETWTLVKEPENIKIIDSKWIFKEKSAQGKILKKARLVARGFLQDETTEDIYAPVARMVTIRTLLSIILHDNLEMCQLDVKSAFLNGVLDKPVYMLPPVGLEVKEGLICKLKKALYGLKEAPKCWYARLNSYLIGIGFSRSTTDPCLFISSDTYILIYVDDMIIASKTKELLEEVKHLLMKEFEMKELTDLKHGMTFLGIKIDLTENEMKLNQTELIEKIISKFGLEESKTSLIPIEPKLNLPRESGKDNNFPFKELIGAIMYIMLGTRPDLSFAITYFSSFQNMSNK